MRPEDPLYFNGLDPRTGQYLFSPQTAERLAAEVVDRSLADEAARERHRELQALVDRGETDGPDLDAKDLAAVGWAAVFPAVERGSEAEARQAAIVEALAPLFELRRRQAGDRFQLLVGPDGHRPGETGPFPYYLLLVASPAEIPFSVQVQLGVLYAVGRIHFDALDDYAAYARSVVAAETGGLQLAREVATFAVANHDDPVTNLGASNFITPLAERLESSASDWTLRRYGFGQAAKAVLDFLLRGGDATPAILLTAGHGLGFARDHALQRRHQGALVCQDWPGPRNWREPIPADHYYSADDLAGTAAPHGLIVVNWASYSAGTESGFISALHQRLLALPRGGALAAVGHVGRAWGGPWADGPRSASGLDAVEAALLRLLRGEPIGAALRWMGRQYAELALELGEELEQISGGRRYDAVTLADLWLARNDARGYAITGDPAVRAPVAPPGGTRRPPGISFDLTESTPTPRGPEQRSMDIAFAPRLVRGVAYPLHVLIRLFNSATLLARLQQKGVPEDSLEESGVEILLDYASDAPLSVRVTLAGQGFECADRRKRVRLHRGHDAPLLTFFVVPNVEGPVQLVVEAEIEDELVASEQLWRVCLERFADEPAADEPLAGQTARVRPLRTAATREWTPEKRLHQLLVQLFTTEALVRWIRLNFGEWTHDLPADRVSVNEMAYAVVDSGVQSARIDAEFFTLLAVEFPRQDQAIAAVRRWFVETAQ